jgi:hypothetical protein
MKLEFAAAALACAAPTSFANAQAVADPLDSPYLQTGCHPKAQVAQALQAAGQVPIITAYRGIPSRPKNYFSTNANLSAGFQFEETKTELCIRAEYRNLHLNNDPNVAIPTWAPLRGAASDSFNQFLIKQRDERGARVIFGAVAVDDQNRPASRIVVTMGRGDEYTINRGATVAGYSDGEYALAMTLADIAVDSRNFPALASSEFNR